MKPLLQRRQLAVIAGLIVLVAAINFVNLSTARAGRRAREVALRKAVGASRKRVPEPERW